MIAPCFILLCMSSWGLVSAEIVVLRAVAKLLDFVIRTLRAGLGWPLHGVRWLVEVHTDRSYSEDPPTAEGQEENMLA